MSVIADLKSALPARSWTEDAGEIAPHLTEWRGLYRGRTPLLLKPATTEEVARAVEICNRHLTPIAVQGGNTGLVGGGVPDDTGAEILLSLKRLNRIRVIDAADSRWWRKLAARSPKCRTRPAPPIGFSP